MAPLECRIWIRISSKDPSEARTTSARAAFFRLTTMRCDASLRCLSSATGNESRIKIALCRFGLWPCRRGKLGWRREWRQPKVRSTVGRNVEGKLHAERRLVECDLFLATDLVGQLFPRRGDVVGAGLRVVLAGEDFGQLVFRDTVLLENAGNARLNRTVRVIVGAELRVQIRRDVVLVVARHHPFVDIRVAGTANLESGTRHHGSPRQGP